MSAAVTKFGGNVLSTQLDLQGTQSRTGFLSMIASCEIDQPELQKLLYDLEAGMPFLFVDQLVVQTALASSGHGRRKVADSAGGVRAMAGSQMMRQLHHRRRVTARCPSMPPAQRRPTVVPATPWMPILPTMPGPPGCLAVTPVPVVPPVTTVRVVAPPTAPAPERALSANPLWAIPLTQLSATRERPIFSPSRRPPPAAVAAEPAIVKAPVVRKKET